MAVMSSLFISRSIATLILTQLFLRLSTAQISGCDAVNCPTDDFGQPICTIGNATADGLGIITFNSSLSPNQPLTWTLFVKIADEGNFTMEKDFLLGTPHSANLTTTEGSGAPSAGVDHACALFFDGISSTLRFPGKDFEDDQGNCGDALTPSCVSDLLSQTRTQMELLVKSTNDNKTRSTNTSNGGLCEQLKDFLQDHPPTTCTVTSNSTWGTILARPLTGPNAATPINPGAGNGCHPTTGGPDYSLSLVATDRINVPDGNSSLMEKVLYGVTPIVTAVYGGDGGTTEVLMDCLKSAGLNASTSNHEKKSGAMRLERNADWNSVLVFSAVFGLLTYVLGVVS